MQSIPRFEVDRENNSIKKQIVTKRHYKIHRGRWLPDQNSRPFSDPDYIWHKCHPFASTGIQNYQIILTKTFPENWDSKAPSVGTLLAYLETTAYIIFFLGIKLFCFKIESWNFQYLFKIEFCETSHNFCSFRQLLFSFFFQLSDWVEIFWRFRDFFFLFSNRC